MSSLNESILDGYKQSEVGVIPNDWTTSYLGDICTLVNGRGFKPHEWSREGLPIIRIQNLNGSDEFNFYEGHYNPKILIKNGQLLFAWSGSRGTSFGPHIWYGEDALLNYHTWKMEIRSGIEPDYFYHALMSLTRVIENSAHGASALVHTQMGEMKKFIVPIPASNHEQTAIANALSDVDALIQELEKLIAKKQAIKTATMQQLLTGRTRLPPFGFEKSAHHPDGRKKGYKPSELGEIPEDWEVVSFGELGQIDPENLGAGTAPDYEFDYVSLEQIDKGTLLGTFKTIFKEAPSRARRVMKKGDVLISTVRPNLMSHFLVKNDVKDTICSTGFSVVRSHREKMCPGYLYQHLFSSVINNQIEMLISGSNYPAINSRDVRNLRVQIGSLEEQSAISVILEDMDDEIQAISLRLSKTRQIKQGMMQELLTGKTRLV